MLTTIDLGSEELAVRFEALHVQPAQLSIDYELGMTSFAPLAIIFRSICQLQARGRLGLCPRAR